jgi:hypothetical protein
MEMFVDVKNDDRKDIEASILYHILIIQVGVPISIHL